MDMSQFFPPIYFITYRPLPYPDPEEAKVTLYKKLAI